MEDLPQTLILTFLFYNKIEQTVMLISLINKSINFQLHCSHNSGFEFDRSESINYIILSSSITTCFIFEIFPTLLNAFPIIIVCVCVILQIKHQKLFNTYCLFSQFLNPSSLQLPLVNQEFGLGLGAGILSQLQNYSSEVDDTSSSGVVLYILRCSRELLTSPNRFQYTLIMTPKGSSRHQMSFYDKSILLHVCTCKYIHALEHIGRSENKFQESVLSYVCTRLL